VIALRALLVLGGLTIIPGSFTAQSQPIPPTQTVMRPASVGKFQLSRVPRQGGLALGLVPIGTKRLVIDGRDVPFAPDRRFLVGFGRDFGATSLITAFLANGDSVTDKVQVIPTQWRIENLKTVARYPQPSAEFQSRRPDELAQINAARRIRPSSEGWRMRFVWPVRGRISGVFGSQRIYAGEPGAPHNGTDIAGPTGASVYAPADGVVTLSAASPFTLEGNLLIIDHGMGLDSAFLHLSRIEVKKGDRVVQGQRIGAIGATGRASGPHLHWGMKWNDERIDPQQLAGPM
jgi:Peptidase family M23